MAIQYTYEPAISIVVVRVAAMGLVVLAAEVVSKLGKHIEDVGDDVIADGAEAVT